MKTMIWKELRENFKWALLAFLVLLVAEVYTLSSERSDPNAYENNLTVGGSAFLMVTSFGCAAIGAAIGIVQILPELPRDRWAALLHRPVSRHAIFFGKALAGLFLYFLATILPFVISIVYVLIPGQFAAPLVPGMIIPGLSDLFLGPVFYFTAILICLHQGRWFGSRGLLGLAAVLIFLLHLSIGWPFLLPILASIFALLAAWGTMAANDQAERMPLATRISRVLVVLAGAQTAWLILIYGLQCLPDAKFSNSSLYHKFQIRRDGQVFVVTQKGDGSDRSLTGADGKTVTDEELVNDTNYDHFLELMPFSFQGRPYFVDLSYRANHPRNQSNYVTQSPQREGPEVWYLLVDQRYFIGYDKMSRRCVGICDAEGFKPAGATAKPFPQPLQNYDYWSGTAARLYWSGPQVYNINFADRHLNSVFNSGPEPIFGATGLTQPGSYEKADRIAVAIADRTAILTPDGKPLLMLPYAHDPVQCPNLWLAYSTKLGRIYLQYTPTDMPLLSQRDAPPPSAYLDEIDAQGNVVHTYSYRTEAFTPRVPTWIDNLATYTSPFLPAVLGTLGYRYLPISPYADAPFYDTVPFPSPTLQITLPQTAILFAIALGFVFVTLAWASRAGFSPHRAGLWALFVFCFGLPGFVTFRLASNWPTRVRCPQCQVRRPIETEDCPSCRKPWPAPAPTGIEIFEPRDVRI